MLTSTLPVWKPQLPPIEDVAPFAEPVRPQSEPADFDEPLWPVNCAIIVLAGIFVGIVCAQDGFYRLTAKRYRPV